MAHVEDNSNPEEAHKKEQTIFARGLFSQNTIAFPLPQSYSISGAQLFDLLSTSGALSKDERESLFVFGQAIGAVTEFSNVETDRLTQSSQDEPLAFTTGVQLTCKMPELRQALEANMTSAKVAKSNRAWMFDRLALIKALLFRYAETVRGLAVTKQQELEKLESSYHEIFTTTKADEPVVTALLAHRISSEDTDIKDEHKALSVLTAAANDAYQQIHTAVFDTVEAAFALLPDLEQHVDQEAIQREQQLDLQQFEDDVAAAERGDSALLANSLARAQFKAIDRDALRGGILNLIELSWKQQELIDLDAPIRDVHASIDQWSQAYTTFFQHLSSKVLSDHTGGTAELSARVSAISGDKQALQHQVEEFRSELQRQKSTFINVEDQLQSALETIENVKQDLVKCQEEREQLQIENSNLLDDSDALKLKLKEANSYAEALIKQQEEAFQKQITAFLQEQRALSNEDKKRQESLLYDTMTRQAEIELANDELAKAHAAELEQRDQKIADLKRELTELNTVISNHISDKESIKVQAENDKQQLQQQLVALNQDIIRLQQAQRVEEAMQMLLAEEKARTTSITEQLTELKQSHFKQCQEIAQHAEAVAGFDREREQLKADIAKEQAKIKQLEVEHKNVLEEARTKLRLQIDDVVGENSALSLQLSEAKANLVAARNAVATLTAAMQRAQAQVKELEGKVATAVTAGGDIKAKQAEIDLIRKQLAEGKVREQQLQTQLTTKQAQLTESEEKLKKAVAEVEKLTATCRALDKKVAAAKDTETELRTRNVALDAELKTVKDELFKAKREITRLKGINESNSKLLLNQQQVQPVPVQPVPQQQLVDLQKELASAKQRIAHLDDTLNSRDAEIGRLQNMLAKPGVVAPAPVTRTVVQSNPEDSKTIVSLNAKVQELQTQIKTLKQSHDQIYREKINALDALSQSHIAFDDISSLLQQRDVITPPFSTKDQVSRYQIEVKQRLLEKLTAQAASGRDGSEIMKMCCRAEIKDVVIAVPNPTHPGRYVVLGQPTFAVSDETAVPCMQKFPGLPFFAGRVLSKEDRGHFVLVHLEPLPLKKQLVTW